MTRIRLESLWPPLSIGSGNGVALSAFSDTASLATGTGDRQERSDAVRQTCGASSRESEEFRMGITKCP